MVNSSKQVPTGVKIISVLYYIGAVASLLFGILMIVGAGALGALIENIPFAALFGGLFVVLGIVMIALAVLSFFIGRGLWKGQKWARIIVIIFAILGLIGAIFNLINGQWSSIISLIINGVIGYYLLFSKSVKAAFA
jgi:hypothetical protein